MPANAELMLLSKIIETGNLRAVLDEGINETFFKDDNAARVWREIWKFYTSNITHGHVPTRDVIEQRCPQVPLPEPGRLPLKSYIRDVVDRHTIHTLSTVADDILNNNRAANLDDLIDRCMRSLSEISRDRRSGQDILLADYVKEAVSRYNSFESATGLRGIPYPWGPLNAETQGMHPGELIVFYGRPKSLKTWVLLHVATTAYDSWNRRVLLYTREMTPEQMLDRTVCLLIRAPYNYYKAGKLHELPVPEGGTMRDRWEARLETLRAEEIACRDDEGHERGFIITSDRDRSGRGGGVVGLRQKIWDHKPDLVCVDAAYLMRNDKSGNRSIKWDEQAAIIQDLKDLALDVRLPIVVTTQANRDSESRDDDTMRDISFADAYGMNCDLAIKIRKLETPDPYVNELALIISGAREISMSGFAIHGCAATNFDVVLHKKHNEEGVVITDDDGNPILVPVVFNNSAEKKAYLREAARRLTPGRIDTSTARTPGELSNFVNVLAAKALGKAEKKRR